MPKVIITKLPPVNVFDPLQPVAINLQYTDPATSVVVTELEQSKYVPRIGNAVSTLVTQQLALAADLGTLADDLAALVIPAAYTPPTVIASGVMGDNVAHPFIDVLSAVTTQFAALRTISGLVADQTNVVTKQPSGLAASDALSHGGVMSGINGWKPTPATVADSMVNLWLTVEDIRAAVVALNIRTAYTCKDLLVDFLVTLSGNGQTATLYFQGYTVLPASFSDSDTLGCVLVIADVDGNSYTTKVHVAAASIGGPVVIDLTTTTLLPTSNYTFTLNSSLTDGALTCAKTVIHTVNNTTNVCPVMTVMSTTNTISIMFTPPIFTGISYVVDLLDAAGTTVVFSQVFTPTTGAPLYYTYTGLTSVTAYKLRMTTLVASLSPVICALVSKSTI